uniref:Uncharacterized protein n=1 Tax=Utricularia reniformis TaxID=192314 RepID=A0A1Y0B417_9LAMI|nr:hypothetical protein AEK19_MT1970 [Utricularia reniformis]ART32133.1 hypothetical protein AEK19_MT1970 [Utricularia reniformis]
MSVRDLNARVGILPLSTVGSARGRTGTRALYC